MKWSRVKWSEAHQVLDLFAAPREGRDRAAGKAPADYFAFLRLEGRRKEAAVFLAHALPRLEAAAWAARCVRDAEGPATPSTAATRALRSALLWVQDPSENRRYASGDAARACRYRGPEALAAMAVYYSGGSISPAANPVVPPPKGVAGRFAATAVQLAAARTGDRNKTLDTALDTGAAMAEEGVSAGP